MKFTRSILAITAACLVVTLGSIAHAESPRVISDVQLGANGSLSGQIVNPQGQPIASRAVTLKQGEVTVARTKTDAKGNFTVAGLNNGIYTLETAEQASMHRLWAAHIAPPSARRGVMVVSETGTVRGQAAGLGGLGTVGTAALIGTGGYFFYEEVIDDDKKPAS